jgi:hypothetical protein
MSTLTRIVGILAVISFLAAAFLLGIDQEFGALAATTGARRLGLVAVGAFGAFIATFVGGVFRDFGNDQDSLPWVAIGGALGGVAMSGLAFVA